MTLMILVEKRFEQLWLDHRIELISTRWTKISHILRKMSDQGNCTANQETAFSIRKAKDRRIYLSFSPAPLFAASLLLYSARAVLRLTGSGS